MIRTSLSIGKLVSSFVISTALTLCATQAAAETPVRKVVVMTSYPEEVVSRFEAGFEKTHPGTRVEIVWRRSGDAATYLREQPGRIDVYWTPAQRGFAMLAKDGAFAPLSIAMKGLPNKVGGFPISDPALRYVATEIAGFGFALNTQRMKERGLPEPKQWTDLTDARWQDELIFPIPGKVGFAPPIVEIITQGYGWKKGWTLLQQIGANAQPLEEGGPNIADEVAKGRVSLGVSIDFFIKSAMANGAPVRFVYPGITGYSPAHVAILKDAPHPEAAKAFTQYVLSDEGQRILFHPDIRKQPVRPSVYKAMPAGYYDPFTAAAAMPYRFDTQGALHRQGLNNTLFDIMVSERHQRLRELLAMLADAEHAAGNDRALRNDVQHARRLATEIPLSRKEADRLANRFMSNFEGEPQPEANAALLNAWREKVHAHRQQAEQIAQRVIAQRREGMHP
ncbi:extracellular solute-binding protein [uncultured Oxalicibacterium sp.]|uniref:ABC transporter substrate-binding protein n=1 Tax=uncultured Oxalicibacterium sp. TaxID=1168540 RepID=UPI0025DFD2DF|nr:extracellular solute-binding protein [uncultured Oxalicibacterium sp.]